MTERTILIPDRIIDAVEGRSLPGRAVVVEEDRIVEVIGADRVPDTIFTGLDECTQQNADSCVATKPKSAK